MTKRARKKKGLRQRYRDAVSWFTRQQVASAKRAKQKVADGKARVKAAEEKAQAKAERDKLKAEARAKRDAAREAERQAATQRAQQRAAERGPVRVGGTIVQTGASMGGGASLCGHPHISDPRQRCGNPVLPGTLACAAGHPQGGSSFGGLRPGQRVVNQHDPATGWAVRG